jgi:hypothetical protein
VKLLKDLIPRTKPRPSAPELSDAEVAAAVAQFRSLEPFCEAEAFASNDGFGASVSFLTRTHRSARGQGAIEVGLRTAALQFKPPQDEFGWAWSDAITPFVKEHRGVETVQQGEGAKDAALRSIGHEAGSSLEGGGTLFGVSAKGSLNSKSNDRSERTAELSKSWGRTRTVVKPLVDIEGARRPFTLRLTAPEQNNLGYFNPDLIRQSFLSAPEPSTMDLKKVTLTLRLPVVQESSDDLIHSLSIQNASGAWSSLLGTTNQKVVSELLISKFLRPLHRPRRLWPRRPTAKP